jgi:hypothetical protein
MTTRTTRRRARPTRRARSGKSPRRGTRGRGRRPRSKTRRVRGGARGGFKPLQCAPTSAGGAYSCYSPKQIVYLKNAWNRHRPNDRIRETDPKKIWLELKSKNKDECDKESCWIKHMVLELDVKREFLDSFAPKSPSEWKSHPNTWLTNVDIDKVMTQYEAAYPCFEFIGPSPIDYDTVTRDGACVWRELCDFQLATHVAAGKKKIGVTFNTDTHDKGGAHWISLFVNVPRRTIFFFDSVGHAAPDNVMKFVRTVTQQGREMSPPIEFEFDQNHPVEHQYTDTECGVYSLYFIVHMLEDKLNGEYLKSHVIGDKHVEKYRRRFFNEDL